jgi:hypothetical protein
MDEALLAGFTLLVGSIALTLVFGLLWLVGLSILQRGRAPKATAGDRRRGGGGEGRGDAPGDVGGGAEGARPTRQAVRREHWTWRALPGLLLGAYVSPRRANKLCRDLGEVEDYVPPLPGHPRLSRTLVAFCQVVLAPITLPMYPLLLGYLAIVYASDRRRARAPEPSPERRRRARDDASRFERFRAYYGLNGLTAARENRPPIDPAVGLRRERMWATVMMLVPGVCGVLLAVQVEVLAGIVCFVWAPVALVWAVRSSKRRAEAGREDRE